MTSSLDGIMSVTSVAVSEGNDFCISDRSFFLKLKKNVTQRKPICFTYTFCQKVFLKKSISLLRFVRQYLFTASVMVLQRKPCTYIFLMCQIQTDVISEI